MLIYLWKEHESKFKSSKFRKDTVWKEISEKLWKANNNWRYSATQCENKWKDLRKTYVKVKDHNNTSGNSTKTCKFFDDINDILSDKPRITPISVASNLRKRPLSINSTVNSVNCSSDSENYDLLCDTDLDVEEQTKITKKPRRQKDFDELKTVLQSTAKEREEARERRHQEMLNQSEKAINTMKDVMLKLIEKF
ncbi:hypothetical protein ALC62_15738 [Cyphomyrmex costatus]|uniref:Myb/SANT-like DNA-binding domain-containing protein n=1 Tax=Cyphomyrmex costatus TaxID=456900 RepID=A0A151I6D8_9HYME|nr:hypothetical protein ALC62_15738 [Cyphomyrmex costatus]